MKEGIGEQRDYGGIDDSKLLDPLFHAIVPKMTAELMTEVAQSYYEADVDWPIPSYIPLRPQDSGSLPATTGSKAILSIVIAESRNPPIIAFSRWKHS